MGLGIITSVLSVILDKYINLTLGAVLTIVPIVTLILLKKEQQFDK